uniref:Fungal lipase-like domain-containing protein n=1 Tax=Panagrolaimus davidi TaxID=227884 RepID=A0A914QIL4_9BILA
MGNDLRNFYMPFAAAAYSDTPNKCLKNIQKWLDGVDHNPNQTISVYRQYKIKCPSLNDICSGYTAITNTYQNDSFGPIIIAFKGPTDPDYFYASDFNYTEMVPFVGIGKVNKQFLDAFNNIWINAGMKDDILTLKNKNPFSNFIIVGHSTGGAMASLAAVTIAASRIAYAQVVGLFTFGQPRTGDKDFADTVTSANFWRSDRVVHNADIVSHLPSINDSNYYHHISEMWWPNNMANGSDYIKCSKYDGEDPECSNSLDVSKLNFDDHKIYFGRKFSEYGVNGCSDLITSKNEANEKRL